MADAIVAVRAARRRARPNGAARAGALAPRNVASRRRAGCPGSPVLRTCRGSIGATFASRLAIPHEQVLQGGSVGPLHGRRSLTGGSSEDSERHSGGERGAELLAAR